MEPVIKVTGLKKYFGNVKAVEEIRKRIGVVYQNNCLGMSGETAPGKEHDCFSDDMVLGMVLVIALVFLLVSVIVWNRNKKMAALMNERLKGYQQE